MRNRRRRKPYNFEIEIRHPDQTDRMVKKFIKKTKKEGIIDEARERRYYTKPSDARRLKRKKRKQKRN